MQAYLRSGLLGGVDGVVTSLAIVAGASFLSTSTEVVAVVGTSSLLADGVSMGISEYLSTRSEGRQASASLRMGLTCLAAFVVFGSTPLVTYVAGDSSLVGASSVAVLTLLLLGSIRAAIVRERVLCEILEVVGLGTAAGGVAFGAASLASEWS